MGDGDAGEDSGGSTSENSGGVRRSEKVWLNKDSAWSLSSNPRDFRNNNN